MGQLEQEYYNIKKKKLKQQLIAKNAKLKRHEQHVTKYKDNNNFYQDNNDFPNNSMPESGMKSFYPLQRRVRKSGVRYRALKKSIIEILDGWVTSGIN